MDTTTPALTWKRYPSGEYATTLPDGTNVYVRPTGQRNGRALGGAWRAIAPAATRGDDPTTIARGGTLAACKAGVERYAAERTA